MEHDQSPAPTPPPNDPLPGNESPKPANIMQAARQSPVRALRRGTDLVKTISGPIRSWLRSMWRWWDSPRGERLSFRRRYLQLVGMIHSVGRVGWTVRSSVVVAPLVFFMLAGPEQSLDLHQALGEDIAIDFRRPLLFGLGHLAAGAALWHWARALTYMFAIRSRSLSTASLLEIVRDIARSLSGTRVPEADDRVLSLSASVIPRLLGLIPGVGSMVACVRLMMGPGGLGSGILAVFLIALLACVLLWCFFRYRRKLFVMSDHVEIRAEAGSLRNVPDMTYFVLTISFVGGAALMGAIIYSQSFAMTLGVIPIVLLASTLWVGVGSSLVWAESRLKVPVATLLVVVALFFSTTNWSDNHRVRTVAGTTTGAPFLTLDAAFEAWRGPKPEGTTEPLPVIVVCAEGGGIYAAHFTSVTLACLDEEVPGFRDHLFAVSGVSGGSVGASMYSAVIRDDPNQVLSRTRTAVSRDLLAPVLAYAAVPDLAQRFVPIFGSRVDRARALELSFESAFPVEAQGMKRGFDELWRPAPARRQPLLMLNTTHVESGARIVAAPFLHLGGSGAGGFETFREFVGEGRDDATPGDIVTLRLSTAAGLSARFPLVTPAASVPNVYGLSKDEDSQLGRLVDGGYFDNPGSATLADTLNVLARRVEAKEIRLFVIRIGALPGPRFVYAASGLGESMSPLRTLLNTRGAHSRESVERLRALATELDAPFVEVLLDTAKDRIPLGWVLSQEARKKIEVQVEMQLNEGRGESDESLVESLKAFLTPSPP